MVVIAIIIKISKSNSNIYAFLITFARNKTCCMTVIKNKAKMYNLLKLCWNYFCVFIPELNTVVTAV